MPDHRQWPQLPVQAVGRGGALELATLGTVVAGMAEEPNREGRKTGGYQPANCMEALANCVGSQLHGAPTSTSRLRSPDCREGCQGMPWAWPAGQRRHPVRGAPH